MANLDTPRGFRLYQLEGKVVRAREYVKTAGQNVYEGALVKRVAAGTLQVAAPADSGIVGVAAATSLATDPDVVMVFDDPEATFVAETTGVFAAGDEGVNVDIAAGTDDTNLLRSGQIIDMATKATTANLPFKIIKLANPINQEENLAGANADVLVKLNNCERAAGTAGIV